MRKFIYRFGQFYSKIMIDSIGIFIFVGILSVVFGDCGWMPNRNIYAISQFVYQAVIPILIAYTAGNQRRNLGRNANQLYAGGVIAVMATAGILLADAASGILFAMLCGPLSGMLWEKVLEPIVERGKSGLEMLIRNIAVALTGSVMAIFSFYIAAPILSAVVSVLSAWINFLIEQRLIFLLSVIIEPAKVLFLNNSINHGILLPLGMQQAEQTGESLLFLLETNPGPGLGILLALYSCKKEKRKEYFSSIFVELVGGVHEIYFPIVLSNVWLIFALIGGGAAGNFCFSAFQAAATGAISPGSILIILLLSTKNRVGSVLLGILVSAAVSAVLAVLILRVQIRWKKRTEGQKELLKERNDRTGEEKCGLYIKDREIVKGTEQETDGKMEEKMVQKIGVICNAGVGSSAIGAALFRRKLKEMGITEIEVSAYASDQIPEDVKIVICQRDFKEWGMQRVKAEIYTVENLLDQAEYLMILKEIQERGGGEEWI